MFLRVLRATRHSAPILARSLAYSPKLAFAPLHVLSSQPAPSSHSSVNSDEIAHFSKLSQAWWDERGEFGLLHKMNPVRIDFVRQKMLEMRREDGFDDVSPTRPLYGLDVLDVGCGGGLLSETLTRLGGRTLGIDASASNIAIASLHASADPGLSSPNKGSLVYEHTSVEDLLAKRGPKSFDVVCSMEVLEHVDNPATFLTNCASLVKPGGHLFLSTIARTPLSYALTIFAAEQLLRLVTPGTHTHFKYINPGELTDFFLRLDSDAAPGQDVIPNQSVAARPWISRLYGGLPSRIEAEVRGIVYLPWKGEWMLVPRGASGASIWAEACNYLFWVRRPFE